MAAYPPVTLATTRSWVEAPAAVAWQQQPAAVAPLVSPRGVPAMAASPAVQQTSLTKPDLSLQVAAAVTSIETRGRSLPVNMAAAARSAAGPGVVTTPRGARGESGDISSCTASTASLIPNGDADDALPPFKERRRREEPSLDGPESDMTLALSRRGNRWPGSWCTSLFSC
eukprot:TRINITY_DN50890_c0_g1_i3.p1 TRINITY_DN50890_c0_g1~~TRINITY_DN50890_c0_g1_i3.p1  ORF type:complete len:171 (-),score=22.17 TRINITY_DN50890_c0_g1_i3:85-597(-)